MVDEFAYSNVDYSKKRFYNSRRMISYDDQNSMDEELEELKSTG